MQVPEQLLLVNKNAWRPIRTFPVETNVRLRDGDTNLLQLTQPRFEYSAKSVDLSNRL